jgi:hypothetical protein
VSIFHFPFHENVPHCLSSPVSIARAKSAHALVGAVVKTEHVTLRAHWHAIVVDLSRPI